MNLNKLTKEYKKAHEHIRELKARVDGFEAEKTSAVAAVQIQLNDAKAQLQAMSDESANRGFLVRELASEVAELQAKVAEKQRGYDDLHAVLDPILGRADVWTQVDVLIKQHAKLTKKVADHAPTLTAAQEALAGLQALLDKVRDKMSRKELEREQAMLNRAALAGIIPRVNRR